LWTIAFISFSWYSQSSRDSKRISDINSIQKSLELYITEKWTYPIPDNNVNIIYSWATAWIEWTIWDQVIRNLDKINKKPIDPLTENEYTYSVTSLKTEYQIWAISEWWQLGYKLPIKQTYAASKKQAKAMIRWTYNEKYLRVQSWTLNWILALPSIIVADTTEKELQTILNNKKLTFNNYSNLPHSYNNMWYTMTGWFDYTNSTPLIYSGSLKILADEEDKKIEFITNLKKAYEWTILQWNPEYAEIINIDTQMNQTNAINLVNNYINTKVWWIWVTWIQNIPMSDTVCGVSYRKENWVCVENTREWEVCLGLPANAIWNSVETIKQTWNGTIWVPSTTATYNITPSTTQCVFKCNLWYSYQNWQCNFVSPSCSVWYTYNTSRDKCEINPTCASGYTYDTSTKLCQKLEQTNKTPTWNCAVSISIYQYWNNWTVSPWWTVELYHYNSWAWWGIYSRTIFNSSCRITSVASIRYGSRDSASVSYDPGQWTTSQVPFTSISWVSNTTPTSCPSGYTVSGTICTRTLTATPTCLNSGILNTSVNLCQLNSTCSIGVLDTSLDACVEN
jgi:hypothetical protein